MTNEATRLAEARERLRKSIGWLRDGIPCAYGIGVEDMVVIDEALAALAQPEVSEEARDAARYRWLRTQHWSDKTLTVTNPKSVGLGRMTYGREGLDAAIDAAMASQEKPHD